MFSVAPVPLADNAEGYLYLVLRGFSGDTLAQRIKQSYVLQETLWLIGSGLAGRAVREARSSSRS